MTDTMTLWDAVSKTNPSNTKKVAQRGGFTSICAHSQIMEATRQFGPVGSGWGYTNGEPIFHDLLVIVPVTIWHGSRENTFGPVYGGAEWKSDKGRLDSDAAKKAATDGLTKGLSQLGFNADVFLGLYDDNKYVEQMQREFSADDTPDAAPELIGPDDVTRIEILLEGNSVPVAELLAAAKVAKVTDIRAERVASVMRWIERRIAPPAEKEAA